MAVTVTWSVFDMKRDAATGGVTDVYWECRADAPTGDKAVEGGVLTGLTYDAGAEGFVAFADLTEETVVGWVRDSLGSEEAGALETRVSERVDAIVAAKNGKETGLPW